MLTIYFTTQRFFYKKCPSIFLRCFLPSSDFKLTSSWFTQDWIKCLSLATSSFNFPPYPHFLPLPLTSVIHNFLFFLRKLYLLWFSDISCHTMHISYNFLTSTESIKSSANNSSYSKSNQTASLTAKVKEKLTLGVVSGLKLQWMYVLFSLLSRLLIHWLYELKISLTFSTLP